MTDRTPRLLVVSAATHGHRSFATALVHALERAAVPVHSVQVPRAWWNRTLGVSMRATRGADLQAVRRQVALDLQLGRFARRAMADYDLVHVVPTGFARAFATASGAGTALLSVGMDCTAELMRDELGSNALQESLRHRLDAVTFGRADHVACYSEWARQSVLAYYDCDPATTDVVAPSAPVPSVRVARSVGRTPRIAFVGTPWKRKGGDRLLHWWREGRLGASELHILCRGAPDDIGREPGVVLHPPMPRAQVLAEFLPSCDLFVLPTRRDQSPWVLAEAAAAGLATVASRLGAIPELVVDGTTGYLCSPDDDDAFCARIRELVADEGLRTRMGVAAHRYASTNLDEFGNFDRFAQRLVTLAAGVRTG